jgi:hypothetical protein
MPFNGSIRDKVLGLDPNEISPVVQVADQNDDMSPVFKKKPLRPKPKSRMPNKVIGQDQDDAKPQEPRARMSNINEEESKFESNEASDMEQVALSQDLSMQMKRSIKESSKEVSNLLKHSKRGGDSSQYGSLDVQVGRLSVERDSFSSNQISSDESDEKVNWSMLGPIPGSAEALKKKPLISYKVKSPEKLGLKSPLNR